MANDFEVAVEVAAAPEVVWELAGDPARIGEWFAPIVACEVDGDIRRVRMGTGAELMERIVDVVPSEYRYSYSVLEGIPGLTSHKATIRVDAAPGGSRIRWHQTATSEVEGYDIERRLSGVMTAGLEALRDTLEGVGG